MVGIRKDHVVVRFAGGAERVRNRPAFLARDVAVGAAPDHQDAPVLCFRVLEQIGRDAIAVHRDRGGQGQVRVGEKCALTATAPADHGDTLGRQRLFRRQQRIRRLHVEQHVLDLQGAHVFAVRFHSARIVELDPDAAAVVEQFRHDRCEAQRREAPGDALQVGVVAERVLQNDQTGRQMFGCRLRPENVQRRERFAHFCAGGVHMMSAADTGRSRKP